jgi:uncharacterized protein (DUF952 family)
MHRIGEDPLINDPGALIVHLCQKSSWKEAKARGVYHAPSLDSEGFIHCSKAVQILDVANAFYRDVPDLVLLWIDPRNVDAQIYWERVENQVFPHIYGELKIEAVVKVSDLRLDEDGYYRTI